MLSEFELGRICAELIDDFHYCLVYYITTGDARYLNSHLCRKLRDKGCTHSKILIQVSLERREEVQIASGSRYAPNGDICIVYLPIIFIDVDTAFIKKLKEFNDNLEKCNTPHRDFFLSRKVSLYVDFYIDDLRKSIYKFYTKQIGFECWTEENKRVFT